jgi:hypothetical protein
MPHRMIDRCAGRRGRKDEWDRFGHLAPAWFARHATRINADRRITVTRLAVVTRGIGDSAGGGARPSWSCAPLREGNPP